MTRENSGESNTDLTKSRIPVSPGSHWCAASGKWMMQFIEHRVTDPRILGLIRKWLTAGVSEKGEWTETKVGTPQGASSPPLLANVYLHYVLDQWVQAWREKCTRGDVTSPDEVEVGNTLDFWRVEAYEPDRRLRLFAEMKLPGRA